MPCTCSTLYSRPPSLYCTPCFLINICCHCGTQCTVHTGLVRQEDGQIYDYGSMEETLQLLQSKNIKFIGICQDGCDAYQMDYLVCSLLQFALCSHRAYIVHSTGDSCLPCGQHSQSL